jgi:hypothetical protein
MELTEYAICGCYCPCEVMLLPDELEPDTIAQVRVCSRCAIEHQDGRL